ncbi:MAG: bifunctional acetate--CoA ligase family protein/GNAT family N-acetyltransferase [Longimicrobiales bacterium]|nr:bifunctional acetate--CoA ligase family protein/GNAT family N-acetyltransferase [Longimicrobiales bacterium]
MSIRNLKSFFRPRSIALVGASARAGSVGNVIAKNLLAGGFGPALSFVNPKGDLILGVQSVPSVDDLAEAPELAVLATPPASVPGLVASLGARGTKAVVVITAGFGTGAVTPDGKALSKALLEATQPYGTRVIGPNCLGILAPTLRLNASFSHLGSSAGGLAFVAQSGAIVTAVQDWAEPRAVGFSHLVSLGDMLDVDFGDMLDYLANDPRTDAILLYVEGIRHSRKFMSAARAAARMKPVVAVKGGRFEAGMRAAASHTGAVAGSDAVYDAAFRRSGVLRVHTLEELFGAVETLALAKRHRGNRLAIVTNGGGLGVLAADALAEAKGKLADLSPETVTALAKFLPGTWSGGNPVDIIGDAPGARYEAVLRVVLEDPGVDAILVINCPTAVISREEAAQAVANVSAARRGKTLLTSWVGAATTAEAGRIFGEAGIPSYDTPEQAIRAFMQLVEYGVRQDILLETPPSLPEVFEPRTRDAERVIESAVAEGRAWLSEPEAKEVMEAYGIPTVPTYVARTPAQAAEIATRIGGPVALKILSKDLTHKSDVGGVMLNLEGPALVERAARDMEERVRATHPDAALEGFSVQATVRRPGAREIIIGASEDPQFGPVILFGQGGTAVEVINDVSLGFPPLNLKLARALMSRTRIHRILEGYRDVPAANLDAVALTLVKVSQLIVDLPQVVELDLNPLLVDSYGVMALDARVRVRPRSQAPVPRLAIRPYPKQLEEEVELADGRTLLLRPVLPEDEPALQRMFKSLTPEEVRFRFFVPQKTFSHMNTARFTQIDYDREMVLVLTEPGIAGAMPIFGVVQLSADPDNEKAEFAILVTKDVTALGLGVYLLKRLVEYARGRGIGYLYGDVLSDNNTMLRLAKVLGFTTKSAEGEPGVVRIELRMGA